MNHVIPYEGNEIVRHSRSRHGGGGVRRGATAKAQISVGADVCRRIGIAKEPERKRKRDHDGTVITTIERNEAGTGWSVISRRGINLIIRERAETGLSMQAGGQRTTTADLIGRKIQLLYSRCHRDCAGGSCRTTGNRSGYRIGGGSIRGSCNGCAGRRTQSNGRTPHIAGGPGSGHRNGSGSTNQTSTAGDGYRGRVENGHLNR